MHLWAFLQGKNQPSNTSYCSDMNCRSPKFSQVGYVITKRWHSRSLGRTPTWWHSATSLWYCISHTRLAPFNQGWTLSFSGVWFQNWHCEWRWSQLYLAGTALPPAPALFPSLLEGWDSTLYIMYPTPSLSPSGSNFRLRQGHQKLSGDQGPQFPHTSGCTMYNAESKGLIESLLVWSLP